VFETAGLKYWCQEVSSDLTPGDGFPVFETDFGAVGMLICYDIMFPEAARCASAGAESLSACGKAAALHAAGGS
jgi:predicted amidohydrolase